MPTLFHEIYRKCFGTPYDVAQESTWQWITAQHISDFYAPAYTRDDPPNTCITLSKGHRPKMFLWMIEEYAFIPCHLHRDDRNGFLVLGHELLLLAHSQCWPEERGRLGIMPCRPNPLERLPTCTFKTLECAVRAADIIQLECLAWAVFDNIIGPGEMPPLSGSETYSEILESLAGKEYKGLHMHCPAQTSASFGAGATTRTRTGGPDLKEHGKLQCYSMT